MNIQILTQSSGQTLYDCHSYSDCITLAYLISRSSIQQTFIKYFSLYLSVLHCSRVWPMYEVLSAGTKPLSRQMTQQFILQWKNTKDWLKSSSPNSLIVSGTCMLVTAWKTWIMINYSLANRGDWENKNNLDGKYLACLSSA